MVFLLILMLMGGTTAPVAAHPSGGVLQKTLLSILITYLSQIPLI